VLRIGAVMKYLSVGQEISLRDHEKRTLEELGECLSHAGWSLRSAGKSIVDDCILTGARKNADALYEVLVPAPHYRSFKKGDPFVLSADAFPFLTQERAISMLEAPSEHVSFRSPYEKKFLITAAALAFGADLKSPTRFALTWLRDNDPKALLKTEDVALFYTLKSRGIPVFNLGNQEHRIRIDTFIEASLKRASSF
jgi:hypothetical protein